MTDRSRRLYSQLLCGAAMATVLGASTAVRAEEANFTIPPQSLASALASFSEQAGRPVLYRPEIATAKSSPGASGSLETEVALNQLLAGTGLTFQQDGATFLIVSASDPQSGSAAGAGAEGTVQALIVTAQKREENIQDVPIAMSAFTQEDLTKSQVTGGPDLMTQIPNFTFTKTNFTGYSIQIRGIGTQAISATTDAAVAVAFNNTPFIRNRFFEQEFYDLQRVEVLRGPQGTLYGRNATAGVVNIISAKPSFHYEARLSADIGNFNSTRFEGMVNLPLADDHVALRLAGAWTKRDGYATNELTGNPIDGRDLWSTRVSLRIEPTDSFHVNAIWEHFQEDDDRLRSGKQLCKTDTRDEIAGVPFPQESVAGQFDSPRGLYNQGCVAASLYSPESFQVPNGYALPYYTRLFPLGLPIVQGHNPYLNATQSRDLRVIESSWDPHYKAKNDVGELQISADLGDGLTLTSETAYSSDTIWSIEDFNRFTTQPGAFTADLPWNADKRDGLLVNGVYCDPQLGCSDRLLAVDLSTAKSRQFSQEFRLGSNYEGPFNFSLGANFLRYDTVDKYYVFVNTLTLVSAVNVNGVAGGVLDLPPWGSSQSDNLGCMIRGRTDVDLSRAYDVDNCKYIETNSIQDIQDQGHNYFLSKNPYKLISYAVFGEAYYNISENLKLTAGLRWTVDRKEAPLIPSELLVPYSSGYPVGEVVHQQWREPTGRLALDWKPDLSFTDETLIYGSYAHGYKAGGANPPIGVPIVYCQACGFNAGWTDTLLEQSLTHPKTFKPEFVNAFEIGSKNTLLDGRLTLNGDAFYYDYTGYQISEIVDRSALNHNYDATVWGLELEADWRPLENLRLGFKGGYEKTRIANGTYAIDLMDRTAGDPNWVVVKPFATIPSNCILPTWIVTFPTVTPEGTVEPQINTPTDGIPGACVEAYTFHHDPVTGLPYVANPTASNYDAPLSQYWPNYPGWDPSTAPNHGEGIAKNLSGKELPNAPHYTATVTADYTLPLPNDWLMTLHGDFYYQSEAWTRVFNTPGYDKLKAYTNVNFAAIFSNDDAGWKVMAYVKNVFNKANITGAFLNSDDTGLTTNVFLNEPRLYGLRVTKAWTGGSAWGPGDPTRSYPFHVELGGELLRHDAPYQQIRPAYFDQFPAYLDPGQAQNRDADWGQGGSVRLTYSPSGSPWRVSGGYRWGSSGTVDQVRRKQLEKQGSCIIGEPFVTNYAPHACEPGKYFQLGSNTLDYATDYTNVALDAREDHKFADFVVGKEVGLGDALPGSRLGLGLRYANLKSSMRMSVQGIPHWEMPPYWNGIKYSQHDRFDTQIDADRTFKGAGPLVFWEASRDLLRFRDGGRVDLSWEANGGVLFGKQNTRIDGQNTDAYFNIIYLAIANQYPSPTSTTTTPVAIHRSKSATVPMIDVSLGLSYDIQRVKVETGYRWERYFNAIDGGYLEHKSFDRTIDGPYFKIAVGFGG